jgi:uncharacterized protein (TIGR02231 family)
MRFLFGALAVLLAFQVEAAEISASSTIDAVTVFPRGAEITRTTKAQVAAGNHTIVLQDLPAEADLNSIRVEGKATGRLEIGAVDARRVQVLRKDSEAHQSERRKIEDEIESQSDRLEALQAEIETKEIQKRYIENLAGLPAAAPSLRGGGARPQEDWAHLLGLIGTSMADVQQSLLRQRIKVRETKRVIEDLKKQLAGLAPRQEQRTEAKISVTAGEALTADLLVRYQVRNARWLPLYDARLETGSRNVPSKLVLTRRAAIVQGTGEEWNDVQVALSTARPSGRSSAPDMPSITVDFYEPPKPMVSAAPENDYSRREGRLRSADRVASAAARKVQPMRPILEREADVDIGGYQAVFKVPDRITVPNTGDAKRVKIETIALEPSLVVRAVPKFDARGYLYAKMTLPKGIAPVLPGQAMLFRDKTFVGKGRMPQLVGGEEHELGFGADDAVRVKYDKIGESRGESGIISSSRTDQRKFKISIKNLHERPIAYSILDQRPESLNEDIKVELVGKTRPTQQNVKDRPGVVAWEGKLAPDQQFDIDFGYVVSWPANKKIRYSR